MGKYCKGVQISSLGAPSNEMLIKTSSKSYLRKSLIVDGLLINRLGYIQQWAKAELARQISLHQDDSSFLDSDQLGWLLAIYTQFCEGISFMIAA